MATRSQFVHEAVATVPRGWKVRTKRERGGAEVRIAYPPGRRRKGSGKVISILKPKKNAAKEKTKTRAQVEAMQRKAVRFLNDVADKPDLADDIEDMSVEEYAKHKHITLSNPRKKARLGSGERFASLERKIAARGDVRDPAAVAADIGRRKYGKKKFQELAARGRRRGRKNPDVPLREAQSLYREFHGKAPSRVLSMQMSEARRGTYTALGELSELHFKAPNRELIKLGFEGNHVKLACSPDGNQLYLMGGDQKMDENLLRQFGAEGDKDFVDLGEAVAIVYVTRKGFDRFKLSAYIHKFGEEGGYRPEGFYNRLQRTIILAGGSYHIEAPGIIN